MLKLVTYSDLHLEFGHGWNMPDHLSGDVLVLAGDIIAFNEPKRLEPLLERWGDRPVIFVAGNHEFYNAPSLQIGAAQFQVWLRRYPNVYFLQDESVTIGDIHFFGGTMWTDFAGADPDAMAYAQERMNDFSLIFTQEGAMFTPADSIGLHQRFVDKLSAWFETKLTGSRVVISHHAPVLNPHSQYKASPLTPAFNSMDMLSLIERYQPDLWIYGHTHECDDQSVGRTKLLSNQLGYQNGLGGFECLDFDKLGKPTSVSS